MRTIILLTECLFLIALTSACEGCFDVADPDAGPSEGEGEGEGEGEPQGLALNELMASNSRTLQDSAGGYPDWVELKNLDDVEKDLGGVRFSDDPAEPDRMVFAEGTMIPANGYLIVFCDGDIVESTLEEPHAPFRLAAEGESLTLTSESGEPLDSVTFPALAQDIAYGRAPDGTGDFGVRAEPTPGEANDAAPHDGGVIVDAGCTPPFASAPALFVNEALANNTGGLVDPADGQREPWVEIVNTGATALPLDDVVLSDEADLAATWSFPAGTTIGPGEFLTVFFDAEPAQGGLHAGLLLTPFDDVVSIGDVCGTTFHSLALAGGAADVSVGLLPDGETAAAPQPLTPTPGAANVGP